MRGKREPPRHRPREGAATVETSALHYAKGYRHGEEVSTPHLIGPLRRGRSHQSSRRDARESARVSEGVIYGDGGAALQS